MPQSNITIRCLPLPRNSFILPMQLEDRTHQLDQVVAQRAYSDASAPVRTPSLDLIDVCMRFAGLPAHWRFRTASGLEVACSFPQRPPGQAAAFLLKVAHGPLKGISCFELLHSCRLVCSLVLLEKAAGAGCCVCGFALYTLPLGTHWAFERYILGMLVVSMLQKPHLWQRRQLTLMGRPERIPPACGCRMGSGLLQQASISSSRPYSQMG